MLARNACLENKKHTKYCIANLATREFKACPLKYKYRVKK